MALRFVQLVKAAVRHNYVDGTYIYGRRQRHQSRAPPRTSNSSSIENCSQIAFDKLRSFQMKENLFTLKQGCENSHSINSYFHCLAADLNIGLQAYGRPRRPCLISKCLCNLYNGPTKPLGEGGLAMDYGARISNAFGSFARMFPIAMNYTSVKEK